MVRLKWVYHKDGIIADTDVKSLTEQAIQLERRIMLATTLCEDVVQGVLTVVAAVYLQEVSADMMINVVTSVCVSLRLLWLALNHFLLGAREQPLLDLYQATGGDQWKNNNNWGTARNRLSTWHGITVDWRCKWVAALGNVTDVDLRCYRWIDSSGYRWIER